MGQRHPCDGREETTQLVRGSVIRLLLLMREGEEIPLVAVYTLPLLPILLFQPFTKEPTHTQICVDPGQKHDQHPKKQTSEGYVGERDPLEQNEPEVKGDPLPAVLAGEQHHENENREDHAQPRDPTHANSTKEGASASSAEKVAPEVPVSRT